MITVLLYGPGVILDSSVTQSGIDLCSSTPPQPSRRIVGCLEEGCAETTPSDSEAPVGLGPSGCERLPGPPSQGEVLPCYCSCIAISMRL